uniref:Uncharacterized protein n=1 Tax=Anguilla anguilla TaxID=7936 RepID=A0A0E9SLV1_ANGAN
MDSRNPQDVYQRFVKSPGPGQGE